jgi:hypothetical protein
MQDGYRYRHLKFHQIIYFFYRFIVTEYNWYMNKQLSSYEHNIAVL